MSARSQTVANEAQALEARLKDEGRNADALIVTRLRRSAAAATGTLKTLHADNMRLRRELGLPSFLDERAGT